MATPKGSNNEDKVTYFGTTDARGRKVRFGIKSKDRTKHVYVIGKTGMGKSTALENMAIQDIQNGEGLAFIDPHGKTADLLLDYVPKERIKDVMYFAPFDMDYPIAFNVMEDVGVDKRHLVVAGLMSAFKKIWLDMWSARMEYILQNCLQALLEYPGATLLSINKMLSDKAYRNTVVANVKDPSTKSFWVDEFAKYTERFAAEATPAIQNKVGQFTSNPVIRNIIGQPKSSFDLRKMMDEKKIIIVNLSKGLVGEGNANLLGSMLITKIYLAAMSRADVSEATINKLPNFYLFVDEFQSFANESFANILSEARKYKLNLTMAHQYVEQMSEEVRAAVFGNVGTMISFRVGAFDAELLEKEFAPQFTAEDMVNLGFTQVYLKLMIDGVSSQPFSATTLAPIVNPDKSYKKEVIRSSQEQFGRPRAEVEASVEIQLRGPGASIAPQARPASPVSATSASSIPRPKITPGGEALRSMVVPKEFREERPVAPASMAKPFSGLRNVLAGTLGEKSTESAKIEDRKTEIKTDIKTEIKHKLPTPPIPPKPITTLSNPPHQKIPQRNESSRNQNQPRGLVRQDNRRPEDRRSAGVPKNSEIPKFIPKKPEPIRPSAERNQLKEALSALMKETEDKRKADLTHTPKIDNTPPTPKETLVSAPKAANKEPSEEELRAILDVPKES